MATVTATRPGRRASPDSAALLSLAREIVARAPAITGAELARQLERDPATGIGARLLRQLRAEQEAPPPAAIGADGRALTQPPSDRRAVRVSARLQAEVCELAGIANFHAALERLVATLRARLAK